MFNSAHLIFEFVPLFRCAMPRPRSPSVLRPIFYTSLFTEVHHTAIRCNALTAVPRDGCEGFYTSSPLLFLLLAMWEASSTKIGYTSSILVWCPWKLETKFTLDHRTHSLLPLRSLYGAWTQNLPHPPPHPCSTPYAADVATRNNYLGGTSPTRSDYFTPR